MLLISGSLPNGFCFIAFYRFYTSHFTTVISISIICYLMHKASFQFWGILAGRFVYIYGSILRMTGYIHLVAHARYMFKEN